MTIHKGIRGGVRLEFVQFNFENYDLIDSKLQKVFENFDENWFEFDLFDSIRTTGWSQIIRNRICSKFVQFDLKICNSIDSKGEKWFRKIR